MLWGFLWGQHRPWGADLGARRGECWPHFYPPAAPASGPDTRTLGARGGHHQVPGVLRLTEPGKRWPLSGRASSALTGSGQLASLSCPRDGGVQGPPLPAHPCGTGVTLAAPSPTALAVRSHWKPIFLLGLVRALGSVSPAPSRTEHICEVSVSPDRHREAETWGPGGVLGANGSIAFRSLTRGPSPRPIPGTKELIPGTEGAPLSSGLASPFSHSPGGRPPALPSPLSSHLERGPRASAT